MNKTAGFEGAKIAVFESRMAESLSALIREKGGTVLEAPSVQEIPLDKNPEIFSFGEKLLDGQIDVLILMTGVGTEFLVKILSAHYPLEKVMEALKRTMLVARGPKPLAALKSYGLQPSVTVPEPDTWREIIEAVESSEKGIALEGRTVALQESGVPNESFLKALKKTGAKVIQVPVYRWALPEDTRPLLRVIDAVLAGQVRSAVFTNGTQVRHLFRVASENGKEKQLREAMRKILIASIGPNATEAVQEAGLKVDLEPSHPKMKILIEEFAEAFGTLSGEKNRSHAERVLVPRISSAVTDKEKRTRESLFLKACRLEKTPHTPIWLMRQAGRYMEEYRRIRNKVSFIDLCKNKELAAEVTITAQERIGADAAIIFSDLLLIVEPLGLGLTYDRGDGPMIESEIRGIKDIDRMREIEPDESLSYVFDAVRLTRSCLDPMVPLIGFAGAPFTLASYILEGGGSKNFFKTKQFMYRDPGAWAALMQKICRGLVKYLNAQIDAGADALQVFDSWVGCLGPEDYRRFVLPYTQSVIRQIKPEVPVIHFGTGTGTFLKEMREAGGQVIGVDFRVKLDEAWKTIGHDRAVQGNMDPVVLCSGREAVLRRADEILKEAQGRPGHIFNLGHGILPQTPVEDVIALIEHVHSVSLK